MSAKKRNDLTLADKAKVAELLNQGLLTQGEIAKKFNCSQSQVSRIAKRKAECTFD